MSKYYPLWGTCTSVMAVNYLPKNEVEKLIPPDVALSPQNYSPEGTHPVVFQLNKQKIRILLPFFIMNYYEFIPLIPHVHFKNAPEKQYQMSPILYVSSWLIVLGARIVWHLNKVLAKFGIKPKGTDFFNSQTVYADITRSGTPAVHAKAVAEGEIMKPDQSPNFEELLPFLSTEAIINSPSNQYWTAVYLFEPKKIQGSEVNLQLSMPELPFLQDVKAKSINTTKQGGFKIDFTWKLQWPKSYSVK